MGDEIANATGRSGSVAPSTPGSRAIAARIAAIGAIATVLLGLSIVWLSDGLPRSVQFLPLALSVLVLGLPHGAVDHLVLPRARDEPVTVRAVAGVFGLYLAFGGLYAIGWFIAPAVAFALFILLTLFHWGQGDVYALVALAGADHLESTHVRWLTTVVRGALPMLVPLVAFPGEYAFVADALIGLFDPGGSVALDPFFSSAVRVGVAVGLGGLIVTTLAVGYLTADDRGPWAIDALETAGLVAYFAVVPPILAIGLYFCFWHSLRHVLRTMLLDDRASEQLARGRPAAAFGRFARDATPLSAVALLVFLGLALAVPTTPAGVADVMALYLVGIAVLTLPHVVVVTLLDLEEGIW